MTEAIGFRFSFKTRLWGTVIRIKVVTVSFTTSMVFSLCTLNITPLTTTCRCSGRGGGVSVIRVNIRVGGVLSRNIRLEDRTRNALDPSRGELSGLLAGELPGTG